MGNSQTKDSYTFYVGDRVYYSEYGMQLIGTIVERKSCNYYIFFQDNGISGRQVHAKFLKHTDLFERAHMLPPPPYTPSTNNISSEQSSNNILSEQSTNIPSDMPPPYVK
jgi:hypothetical protein